MNTLAEIKPEQFGIEKKEAENLVSGLKPHLEERELLIENFKEVKDLEITVENLPKFKELRLKFRDNRTKGINNWHKSAKEIPLRMGQLIDAIKNHEIKTNQTHEDFLEKAEKHFELLEKQRVEQLQKDREEKLSPYVEDAEVMDLGNMQDEVFEAFLSTKKQQYQAQKEAERQAELERQERERKEQLAHERELQLRPVWDFVEVPAIQQGLGELSEDEFRKVVKNAQAEKAAHQKEQERIRKENERLERERIEAEKKAEAERKAREEKERKEREAYEAKLRAEQEAREKAEREAKEREAKLQAEIEAKIKAEREEQERIEAQRQAELKKGDSDKVKDLIADLENLKNKYEFKAKKSQTMYRNVGQLIDKTVNYIKENQ